MSNGDSILEIKSLCVEVGDGNKRVLEDLSLVMKEGTVHALMGQNGSGKSTLAMVIAGNENYKVVSGSIKYKGKDLLSMEVNERSLAGISLVFQYPVEMPGVSTRIFLKSIVNQHRQGKGLEPMEPTEFTRELTSAREAVGLQKDMLKRSLHEGFSGGERKKCEILQMIMLRPDLLILDELDSGLDIDALKFLSAAIAKIGATLLVITHYPRLLHYLVPDRLHIINDGKIACSGGVELAGDLEKKGYKAVLDECTCSGENKGS